MEKRAKSLAHIFQVAEDRLGDEIEKPGQHQTPIWLNLCYHPVQEYQAAERWLNCKDVFDDAARNARRPGMLKFSAHQLSALEEGKNQKFLARISDKLHADTPHPGMSDEGIRVLTDRARAWGLKAEAAVATYAIQSIRSGQDLREALTEAGLADMRRINDRGFFRALRQAATDGSVPWLETTDLPSLDEIDGEFSNEPVGLVAQCERAKIQIRLRNRWGDPFSKGFWRLIVANEVTEGTLADGAIEAEVPSHATEGELLIWLSPDANFPDGAIRRRILIDALDPAVTATGAQARLQNMGYAVGSVDGNVGPWTRRAMREFQGREALKPDGRVRKNAGKISDRHEGV